MSPSSSRGCVCGFCSWFQKWSLRTCLPPRTSFQPTLHCACVDTTPRNTVPALREKNSCTCLFAEFFALIRLAGRSFPAGARLQQRLNRVVEADQRDPHSVVVALPNQISAQL